MAWIRIDDTIRDHQKVKRAAKDLGIAPVAMAGHLVWFWTLMVRLNPDGDLSALDGAAIEDAAGWTGEAGKLVDSWVKHRLLDQTPSGLRIHDWSDYAGSYRESQRKAEYRERARSQSSGRASGLVSRDSPADRTDGQDGQDRRTEEGAAPPSGGACPADSLLVFKAIGTGPREWALTLEHVATLEAAYPGIDVRAEMRKAQAKIATGAVKPKTANGYPRFVANWLDRAANSARPTPSGGWSPVPIARAPATPPRSTQNQRTAELFRQRLREEEKSK